MEEAVVPEKVLPGPLWGHHAGVVLLVLYVPLHGRQLGGVVPRQRILPEPRAVRGRVEPGRLLEHDGLVVVATAGASFVGGVADEGEGERSSRCGDPGASPERALLVLREQNSRDDRL